ncbi:MAG: hypothetical protein WC356_07470 [Candidatus Micrarchaeia archaeon]|jgi:hypothetical protein
MKKETISINDSSLSAKIKSLEKFIGEKIRVNYFGNDEPIDCELINVFSKQIDIKPFDGLIGSLLFCGKAEAITKIILIKNGEVIFSNEKIVENYPFSSNEEFVMYRERIFGPEPGLRKLFKIKS